MSAASAAYSKVYHPKWRAANRDKVNTYSRTYNTKHWRERMLTHAKSRAKKANIPFNITLEDLTFPEFCPALRIPLVYGPQDRRNNPNSASLDRIVPSQGYVRGNVQVLSLRANLIKQNATAAEILAVGNYCAMFNS